MVVPNRPVHMAENKEKDPKHKVTPSTFTHLEDQNYKQCNRYLRQALQSDKESDYNFFVTQIEKTFCIIQCHDF